MRLLHSKWVWFLFVLVVILFLLGFVHNVGASKELKVTICHATASQTNPYVSESVALSSLGDGHGTNGINLGDIVPPTPNTDFPEGNNWTLVNQAIYNNDCQAVVPTETPAPEFHYGCVENSCQQIEGKGDNTCASEKDCQPIPTAVPTETPSNPNSTTNTPVCSDGSTVQLPANPFVIRKGDSAVVNFFITEGDSANIYYKVVGQNTWQYSVIGVKPGVDNFVSFTISGLDPKLGYDFGIQQVKGCGGGQLVTAVVVDGATYNPVLFKFSYWIWSK